MERHVNASDGRDRRVGLSLENLNGRYPLESLSLDRNTILKCTGKE